MYVLLGNLYISHFVSVRVLPSEFVALYLFEMHDEIRRQIIVCNDDYNFAAYSYSILL